MPSLVSLVMTDISGSTRRWAADDVAMAADLETHDRLLGDVVDGAGGRVFKHTGDGMIAVFDDPVAAVGAAAAIQRAIGDTTWRHADGVQVRAAVHSGVVYERDGDMFGTAVNKVARILGVCPAGAVLVSNATAALLTERAAEGLSINPVGSVQLSGFTSADDIYAVTGAGVAGVDSIDDGAAADVGKHRSELPSIDDELVGRTDELAAVWDALSRSRLVTLTGVGGMGKTRLALEVAAGGTDSFSGGVWWIDLSAATAPEAVLPVAMTAVGARETPGRTALQALGDHFVGQEALVVVDNCEHVLATARDMVTALRTAAADVRVVCTSREALGVRGEQIIPVGSLPTVDGVALFIERALAVRPDLDTTTDHPIIERLCTRLDGIPLAIELAAARCRSMTPAEIDTRLDDRFRLLRGGRTGTERHRTLHAAVAWSHSLLDPDERTVFDQMAVFAGGTLIDGLATVCNLDDYDALDIVDRLVSRSMVVATRTPLGTRYHQLETLRQYAEDRLIDTTTVTTTRNHHLTWTNHLAEQMRTQLGTPNAADAIDRFAADVDNFRVAVAHALATDRHAVAHRIVAMVWLMALDRPAWEVADWVHPLHLPDGWTEDAAICAAAKSWFDSERLGPRGRELPVGGVPMHFVESNGYVALSQAMNLASNGHWADTIEFIDRNRFADDYSDCWVTCLKVYGMGFGVNAHGAIPEEVDALVDVALGNLELSRRIGDQQLLAHCSYFAAYALLERDPMPAIDYGSEAITIAERLNSQYLLERATAVWLTARSAAVCAGQLAPDDVAADVRAELARSFELSHLFIVGTLLRTTSRLLARFDTEAAALIALSVRHRSGMAPPAHAMQLIDADTSIDRPAIEARAATLTAPDSVEVALAALDRLIAGIIVDE